MPGRWTQPRRWQQPPWWPFGAKKPLPTDVPTSIPIYETDFEGTITLILEMARAKAETVSTGEEFTIDASTFFEKWSFDPVEVIGPVMFRAGEYGVMPGVCVNGKFRFTKI